MENNWICTNCGAEVPNNFGVCWNCEAKQGEILQQEAKTEDLFLSAKKYNIQKIHLAGKQLKNVGKTIIFLVFFHFIFRVLELVMGEFKSAVYYFYYLVIVIGILVLTGILFSAGDTLQEVIVKPKKAKKE